MAGRGTLPRSKRTVGPVCRGESSVEVDPPAIIVKKPFTECRQRRGTGVEANNKLPCLAFPGSGVRPP